MKKIISWVKRPANMNFLAFIGIAVVLLILAFDCHKNLELYGQKIGQLGNWIENTTQNNIGYFDAIALFFGFFGFLSGTVGDIMLKILTVYIPIVLSIFPLIQAIFLRVLYKESDKGRILCYRIFMGISCFIIEFFTLLYVSFILSQVFYLMKWTIIITLITLAALIICIINTYTKRINDKEKLCTS